MPRPSSPRRTPAWPTAKPRRPPPSDAAPAEPADRPRPKFPRPPAANGPTVRNHREGYR